MTDSQEADARDRVGDIYELYAPRVAAYALRRATGTDAADVVAETFLVAWRRRDIVPGEPDTLPWLYGVARRVLANQRRGNRRSEQLRDRLASQFAQHDVDPPSLEDAEEFQRVAKALRKLSEHDAEVLRLTAWEALSPSEIATTMGISPGTARQRISRARQRLRKHLATDGFEVDISGPPPPCTKQAKPPVEPGDLNGPYLYSSLRGGVTR